MSQEAQNHVQEQSRGQNALEVKGPLPFVRSLSHSSPTKFIKGHSLDHVLTVTGVDMYSSYEFACPAQMLLPKPSYMDL